MTVIVIVFLCLWPQPGNALRFNMVRIKIPEHCQIIPPKGVLVSQDPFGSYRLFFSDTTVFPLELVVKDLFGVKVSYWFKDPSSLQNVQIKTDIVKNQDPNPLVVYQMPSLCPRTSYNKVAHTLTYHAEHDILNHLPSAQLLDPDVNQVKAQKKIKGHTDAKNSLQVLRVKVSNDYEDNTIVDYQGEHPIQHTPNHLVYEGEGGFYANIHYAVLPYDKRVLNLVKNKKRQEILNLAQGKLRYIDREDLQPALRTHSFLPGPYLSKSKVYELCEWGDTGIQTDFQELYYKNLIVWDWDYVDSGLMALVPEEQKKFSKEKVIMIVWEGDEEDWLIADGYLDPFYLTDDLIGVFVIDRTQTVNKVYRLRNQKGDFEMDVMTEF